MHTNEPNEYDAEITAWLTAGGYASPDEWMADSDFTQATSDGDPDADVPIFAGDWLHEEGHPVDVAGTIAGAMEAEALALSAERTLKADDRIRLSNGAAIGSTGTVVGTVTVIDDEWHVTVEWDEDGTITVEQFAWDDFDVLAQCQHCDVDLMPLTDGSWADLGGGALCEQMSSSSLPGRRHLAALPGASVRVVETAETEPITTYRVMVTDEDGMTFTCNVLGGGIPFETHDRTEAKEFMSGMAAQAIAFDRIVRYEIVEAQS